MPIPSLQTLATFAHFRLFEKNQIGILRARNNLCAWLRGEECKEIQVDPRLGGIIEPVIDDLRDLMTNHILWMGRQLLVEGSLVADGRWVNHIMINERTISRDRTNEEWCLSRKVESDNSIVFECCEADCQVVKNAGYNTVIVSRKQLEWFGR